MNVEPFVAKGAHRRQQDAHIGRQATCHDRVGRDLLDTRRGVVRRDMRDHLLGAEPALRDHAVDAPYRRRDHWQGIRETLLVAELLGILALGNTR